MAQENIDVTVDLHDQLSMPANRAEHAVDDLGDQVNELDAEMAAADITAGRLARRLAALRRAAGGADRELDKTSRSTRAMKTNANGAGGGVGFLAKMLNKAGDGGKFLGSVMKAFKWSAFATAATLAATAVSALGAASFAAIAGLSPLVGVLGALPALLVSVLSIVGAVKLGFAGIGDALKAVTDSSKSVDEVSAALVKLNPEAREFVLTLADMKKRTDGWTASIQAAMLPAFTASLHKVAGIFPVIKHGLTDNAGAVGRLAFALSHDLSKSGDELQTVFARNTRIIDNGLTPALTAAYRILRSFLVAGGPLAERFSNWVGVAATNLAHMVSQGEKSGRLEAFLDRSGDLAAVVGKTLADVSVALFNIGKQSDALSQDMGGGLDDLAARWRAWTETVAGQNAIRQWFEDARPVVRALGDSITIIAKSFAQLATDGDLAQLINQINETLLPSLLSFADGAAQQLGPALVQAGDAFIKFESLLSYSPMADLLFTVASAVNGLLTLLTALPAPVKFAIAALFAMNLAFKGVAVAMAFLKGTSLVSFFAQVATGAQAGMIRTQGFSTALGGLRGAAMGASIALGGISALLTGGAMLAVVGLTYAWSQFKQGQAKTKAEVDDLTAALDQQTGAITDNAKASVAKALQDAGAFKDAEDLGLSLDVVTGAAVGNTAAIAELDAAYTSWMHSSASQGVEGRRQNDVWNELHRTISGQNDVVDEAVKKTKEMAEATGANASTTKTALSAQDGYAHGVRGSADALERQAAAANKTRTAVIALNDTLVSQQRTLVGFRQAMADSAAAINKNAHTMDLHTQAGRDNRLALLDVADAASKVENAAQRTRAIKEAKKYIAAWADEAGWSKTRADNYADSLFNLGKQAKGLPKTAKIDVQATGIGPVLTDLQRIQQARDALTGPVWMGDLIYGNSGGGGGGGKNKRRDGGAVWEGQTFTVGEVGPELLVGALSGKVSAIGEFGQQQMQFSEPGYVLPNEVYEAATANPELPVAHANVVEDPPPPRRSGGGGDDDDPPPPIHINLPHAGHMLTEADVEAAALRAYRRWEREKKERGNG